MSFRDKSLQMRDKGQRKITKNSGALFVQES